METQRRSETFCGYPTTLTTLLSITPLPYILMPITLQVTVQWTPPPAAPSVCAAEARVVRRVPLETAVARAANAFPSLPRSQSQSCLPQICRLSRHWHAAYHSQCYTESGSVRGRGETESTTIISLKTS